jgi:hypothetical protein
LALGVGGFGFSGALGGGGSGCSSNRARLVLGALAR